SENCGNDPLSWARKKPRNSLSYGAFLLEAEVGIEPAFTDLQSEVKPNNFRWLTVDNFRIIAVFVSLEAAD
ncbi:hypothetical protein ACIUW0_31290, partial [Pseudomonas aeruginosa]